MRRGKQQYQAKSRIYPAHRPVSIIQRTIGSLISLSPIAYVGTADLHFHAAYCVFVQVFLCQIG